MTAKVISAVSLVCILLVGYYKFSFLNKPFFNEGEQCNYSLKFSTHFEKTNNSYQIQDDIGLEAILNLRVFQVEKNFIYLGFSLSNVEFSLSNALLKENLQRLYQTIVIVKVSNEGKFLNYYTSINDNDVQGLLQLYATLQTVVQEQSSYEAQEFDMNAPYRAKYHKHNNFLNKKRYYSNESIVQILNSSIAIKIDKDYSWIQTLELQESFTTSIDKKILIQNSNNLSLRNKDRNVDKSLPLFMENRRIETILEDFAIEKEKSKSLLKEIEKKSLSKNINDNNITLESLIEKNTINDISKYLAVKNNDIEKLFMLINKGDDNLDKKYIYAFEKIGSPQAQKFLQEIATSDEQTHMNRLRAIISLGAQKSIIQSSVDTLNLLITDNQNKELSDTAQLSLGSIASNNPASFGPTIDQNLRDAHTQNSANKILLLSMQNSGAQKFADEILRSAQTSTKVSDKVLALNILSDVESNEVDSYLEKTYFEETVDEVKAEALLSLSKSEVDPLVIQDIQTTLSETPPSKTRTQMIEYLVKNVSYDENNKIILKKALKSETDKQNIKTIIRAIR